MASNIKYPENQAMYFIEGDKLALITKVDSSGNGRTSSRKQWKAISEAVTDGILIHYYAEPNSVSAVTDNLDIDNALELAVVDYVKKCLYMDKAGTATDAVVMQASMSLANNDVTIILTSTTFGAPSLATLAISLNRLNLFELSM